MIEDDDVSSDHLPVERDLEGPRRAFLELPSMEARRRAIMTRLIQNPTLPLTSNLLSVGASYDDYLEVADEDFIHEIVRRTSAEIIAPAIPGVAHAAIKSALGGDVASQKNILTAGGVLSNKVEINQFNAIANLNDEQLAAKAERLRRELLGNTIDVEE